MNVREFVLTRLERKACRREELAEVLGQEQESRLDKTLSTLERQGKIRKRSDGCLEFLRMR